MRTQRFGTLVAAGPGGRAVIVVPFDPDEVRGAKAEHPVNGTAGGRRVRVTLSPGGSGGAFTLSPARMRDIGVVVGDEVLVELAPEGPQRADLAEDISAALALTRPRRRSSTRWRSSTAGATSAGSTRPPAGRRSAWRASLRSWTSSRPGSRSGHDRERNISPPDGPAGISQRTAPGEPRLRTGNRRPHRSLEPPAVTAKTPNSDLR
jgi:translation initiation factor IF-1